MNSPAIPPCHSAVHLCVPPTHVMYCRYHFTMLAWLPTYFRSTLNIDLLHAAQTSLLPPLAGIAVSAAAGPLADKLIAGGRPVGWVRKLMQSIAFLVPSACIMASTMLEPSPVTDTALITIGLGVSSFALAGLYCTHQDMSPKYAGGCSTSAVCQPQWLCTARLLTCVLYAYTHMYL